MSAAPSNTTAISNTPQAKDDAFATVESGGLISIAGLMANDAGGGGKSFYGLYGSTTTTWGAALTIEGGAIRYDGSNASRLQSLAAGQTVTDTFQYAIQLGKGVISIATVTVTVTGSNDGPVAVADVASMTENQSIMIDALANDTDVDSGAVKSLVSVTSSKGEATIESGKIRFDPGTAFDHLAQGATENVVLTYAMTDEHGAQSESTVTITITGTNDGPVATADFGAGSENQALLIDVLANDSDVDDGAVLTIVSATASKGEVAIVDNKVSFQPGTAFDALEAGATESVVISYSIADDHGATTSSTLTVTVTGTNDAPVAVADTASGAENDLLTIDALANDTDVDSGATRTLVEATVSKGEVRIDDGKVVFDPGAAFDALALGATEQVSIGYTIADEHGAVSASTITVTVTGTNDGPVATADAAATSENQSVVVDVLANDIDVDSGAFLTLVSVTASRGEVSIADGRVLFDPGTAFDSLAAGEQTQVILNYVVQDEHGATASSTATVTVTGTNDGPVAVADTATTSENQAVIANVLANDTDVDGAARTLLAVEAPKGNASIVDGAVVFDPGTAFDDLAAGQREDVVVTYTIADEYGVEATSTLTVTVTGTNDGPVVTSGDADAAGAVVEAGSENGGGTPSATGMLSSSDVDQGSSATWSGNAAGAYGSFAIGADGAWTYTLANDSAATQALAEGEVVTESFTATVIDEHGATASQIITIEVTGAIDNRAPTASAVQATVAENGPAVIGGFLGDDVDGDDDASTLSYELLSGPAAGVLTNNGDGSFAFDPAGDFEDLAVGQGRDVSFSYRSIDSHGAISAPATVVITVTGSNDGPVITSGPATGTAIEAGALDDGTPNAGTPTVGGTLTATDIDQGAALTWTGSANGSYGSFSLGADGSWTYTLDNSRAATQALNEGQTASETFTARVTDDRGAFVTRAVTITVNGTNDVPTVTDVALTGGSTTTGGFVIGNTVIFGLTDNNGDGRPETGVSATTVQLGGSNNGSLARDIDGDGDVDFVTSTGNGAVVHTNRGDINGDGRIDFSAFTIAGATNTYDVAVADLNGDGRLDIALGNGNGSLFEAINLGDTNANGLIDNFSTRTVAGSGGSSFNYGIASGDLNGDGRIDLVQSGHSQGPTIIRYNLGDTNGDGRLDYRVQTLAGLEGLGVAIGDVDGDGRADILQSRWSNQNETLYLNRGDADGDGQITYQAVTLPTGGSTMEGQLADIDRDGDLDILLPNQNGTNALTIGYNRGDTNGDLVPEFAYSTVTAPTSWGLAAGDIDGDGDIDILMSGAPATYLSNNGDSNGDGILEFTSVALNNVAGAGAWDAEFLVQGTGAGAREDGPGVAGAFKGDDVDADDTPATLTYQILTQPSEGSVATDGSAAFSFDPGDGFQDLAAGESRAVTFTYRTIDAHGAASAPATVTVTVGGTNDAPTIVSAATTAASTIAEIADGAPGENATTRTAAGSVGFTDIDISDTHGASFVAQSGGYLGTLTLGAVNQGGDSVGWSFAVADSALDSMGAGQTRLQNYTVTVADGNGGSVNQVVTITLTGSNDAPVAVVDSATTSENLSLSIAVLANDTDVDVGDTKTLTSVSSSLGSASIANNQILFNPGTDFDRLGAGQFENVVIGYTMRDTAGATSSSTLTLRVNGANDAPTAVADTATTSENQTLGIDVIANDTDIDTGDGKSLVSVAASKGSATIVGGQLQFAPGSAFDGLAAGESENVLLSYTMRDTTGATSSSTVTLTVTGANDAPTIIAATTNATGGVTELPVTSSGANVATLSTAGIISFADVDLSDTHSATFAPQAGGFLGTFTLSAVDQAANRLVWDFSVADASLDSLAAGETRTQNYNVTVGDGHGGSVTQVVTIVITGASDNVAPVAGDDSVSLNEDMSRTFDVRGNDADADGDALTVTAIGGSAIAVNGSVAVTGGAVRLNADGSLTFTPTANFNGTPSFAYTVADGNGGTATGTVNLTVLAVNDAPQNGAPPSRTTAEDTTLSFTGANVVTVADIDGGALTTTLTATNGTLGVTLGGGATITGNNSASVQLQGTAAQINSALAGLAYAPATNFNGAATLTVVTSDGLATDSDTIALTVTAANDAPTNLVLSNASVAEGIPGAVVGLLSADNVDPGDVFTYSIRPGLDAAKFTIVGNELRVTSSALDFETAASHSLIVRVTDTAGQFVDRTFTVIVEDRNEITLTTATDVIASPASADVVIATATTLNAADQLNAGAGSDSLLLFNGGTFDLRNVSQFSGFEEVRLINFATDNQTLFLRPEAATVSGAGNGGRLVYLNSGQVNYSGGDGTDQVFANNIGTSAWNDLNNLNGGNGFDFLYVNPGAGPTDLSQAQITSFELLSISGSTNIVRVDADTLMGFSNISGTSGARIVTNVAELDLTNKSISGVLIASDNADGTLFRVNSAQTAASILGGAGTQDTIQAAGFNFTADQRAAIFAVSSVERIIDGNGTVTTAPPADPAVVKLTTAADVVNGDLATLPASITVNTTAATLNNSDQLNGGATGTDSLALYGPGTFDLRFLGQFTGFENVKTINFGTDTLTLNLRPTDAVSVEVAGTGSQQTYLNSGLVQYSGGSGTDQVFGNWIATNGWNNGNSLSGGAGFDYFYINTTTGVTTDLTQATISGFESLNIFGNGLAKVDADTLVNVTQIGGASQARMTTDAASLDLTGKSVSGPLVVTDNAAGTVFRVSNVQSAFAIFGGTGANDAIEAVGFNLTADQRAAIFAVSSVEKITNADGSIYTAPAADPAVIKLTLGNDVVAGDAPGAPASLTVNASSATLGTADQLNGGATGTDILALHGGGTFDLRNVSQLVGFDEIRLKNPGSDFQNVFLRNETSAVIVEGGGSRQMFLSAAQATFVGGSGTDYVYANNASTNAWNVANNLDGGAGFDYLYVSQGSADLSQATITGFESLQITGSATVARVDSDTLAGITQIGGSSGARIVTGDAVLDLTGKSASGVQISSDNAAGTLFKVNSSATAFTIAGGTSANDVIEASGFSFSTDQRTAIFAGGGVDVISDTTGIYGSAAANVLTARSTGSTLFGGAGNDELRSGTGNDVMSGGSGNDTYVFDLAAAKDVIKDFQAGAAGDDVIDLSALKGATNDNGHIQDFADLLANHATELNGSTVISWGTANSITIEGVSVASLTAADFLFG